MLEGRRMGDENSGEEALWNEERLTPSNPDDIGRGLIICHKRHLPKDVARPHHINMVLFSAVIGDRNLGFSM